MSIAEFRTLRRILADHEVELVEEALAEVPAFIRDRGPQVLFDCTQEAIHRWLMFGRAPHVEWLELRSLQYDAVIARYPDDRRPGGLAH